MLFNQKVHPLTFEYASRSTVKSDAVEITGDSFKARVRCDSITEFCTRLRVENLNIKNTTNYSDGIVEKYRAGTPVSASPSGAFSAPSADIEVGASSLAIKLPYGLSIETSAQGFGVNGLKCIFDFEVPEVTGFYGFGERTKRFNKSGDSLDFFTVDVMGIWPHTYWRDDYDPAYVSIPLAILRVGAQYCGLYFDNPERLVMDCGQIKPGHFYVQSMDGHNHLYVINGPTLRDVVRHFGAITGRAELPPAWALGYHQCRWGYESTAQFEALAADFAHHEIPLSTLWYDIDYMDEYRVFTWDKKIFRARASSTSR